MKSEMTHKESACGSCKLSGHCNVPESNVKMTAVLLGFGLPLVVVLLALLVCLWLTSDETVAALVGLAALIPYYIIMWLITKNKLINLECKL